MSGACVATLDLRPVCETIPDDAADAGAIPEVRSFRLE
jgi:hypothetical protein